MDIPFNIPYVCGNEEKYLVEVLNKREFSGNSSFTKKCEQIFSENFSFENAFLTHSGTSALELAASLCNFQPTDEVILPSFAYLTVASSFLSKGAILVFADSEKNRPHICPKSIEQKITSNTKAIVVIHYGGISCDMDSIMCLAAKHNLIVIEDCAHSIDAMHQQEYLGKKGDLSIFSFHETKNIHCGEGGLLVVNKQEWVNKAQKIWQEGSNRNDFQKGLVGKYEWVEMGSSYQPSELNAAFLLAQLENIKLVTEKRKKLWDNYYNELGSYLLNLGFQLPLLNENHNAHIFYIKCKHKQQRDELIQFLGKKGISATFHYPPLHLSPYYLKNNPGICLPNVENWADTIVRLPIYFSLSFEEQAYIINTIKSVLT